MPISYVVTSPFDILPFGKNKINMYKVQTTQDYVKPPTVFGNLPSQISYCNLELFFI